MRYGQQPAPGGTALPQRTATPPTLPPPAAGRPGAVLGWILLHRIDGHWHAAGDVHADRSTAEQALADAIVHGNRAVLAALHWKLDGGT